MRQTPTLREARKEQQESGSIGVRRTPLEIPGLAPPLVGPRVTTLSDGGGLTMASPLSLGPCATTRGNC